MDIDDVAPWPVYSAEAKQRVADLVGSGNVFDYAGWKPVVDLEREFADLHDGAHAITFNSGTSALFAAFAALGIAEGDEVIVPNLTFLASMTPLLWLGANPILVDSGSDDPSIDAVAVERAVTPRTRAVVVTHLFGNPVDVMAVADVSRRHGLRLVEDCSHAHASHVDGRHVGTFGDAAIYSLGSSKMVSGGHGGVLITPDATTRDLAVLTGHFKPRTRTDILTTDLRRYAEVALGGNLRMSPLAAVLALDHLKTLDVRANERCRNVEVLDAGLGGLLEPVRAPAPRVNRTHFDIVYRLPAGTTVSDRARLIDHLAAVGVPVAAPSTRPLSRALAAIRAAEHRDRPAGLLERLRSLARSAPTDSQVAHSVAQHDLMLSFPAGRLYQADTSVAEGLVHRARPVIERFLGDLRS